MREVQAFFKKASFFRPGSPNQEKDFQHITGVKMYEHLAVHSDNVQNKNKIKIAADITSLFIAQNRPHKNQVFHTVSSVIYCIYLANLVDLPDVLCIWKISILCTLYTVAKIVWQYAIIRYAIILYVRNSHFCFKLSGIPL